MHTFDSMDAKTHQIIDWIDSIAAWMSLFLINGIIDFMLTPGSWLQQQNFWVGFFNPTFWPSLVFRTCMSLMLAGCYGFITAVREKDDDARVSLISFSGRWSLGFLILSLPAGWWYLNALPEKARMLVLGASPTIKTAVMAGAYRDDYCCSAGYCHGVAQAGTGICCSDRFGYALGTGLSWGFRVDP